MDRKFFVAIIFAIATTSSMGASIHTGTYQAATSPSYLMQALSSGPTMTPTQKRLSAVVNSTTRAIAVHGTQRKNLMEIEKNPTSVEDPDSLETDVYHDLLSIFQDEVSDNGSSIESLSVGPKPSSLPSSPTGGNAGLYSMSTTKPRNKSVKVASSTQNAKVQASLKLPKDLLSSTHKTASKEGNVPVPEFELNSQSVSIKTNKTFFSRCLLTEQFFSRMDECDKYLVCDERLEVLVVKSCRPGFSYEESLRKCVPQEDSTCRHVCQELSTSVDKYDKSVYYVCSTNDKFALRLKCDRFHLFSVERNSCVMDEKAAISGTNIKIPAKHHTWIDHRGPRQRMLG